MKAKVFISCGQNRNSNEVEIAHRIAERLITLGFDYYIAVEEQSLRGLKENIFAQLESSEYFVFIDFKRERIFTRLFDLAQQKHRGSLFTHQELSIASYLDLPLLAFQEKGVQREDGIMRFLQGNSIEFSDRHLLPSVIADEVQRREWKPNWKNELVLARDVNQFSDAVQGGQGGPSARYFHIAVQNHHIRKSAFNCYVFLESVIREPVGMVVPIETIEFKWAGYIQPNAIIAASGQRKFDAVWFHHSNPTQPWFNVFSDSSQFMPRLSGPGDYRLTYSVVSENFKPAKATFLLHIGSNLNEIRLSQV